MFQLENANSELFKKGLTSKDSRFFKKLMDKDHSSEYMKRSKSTYRGQPKEKRNQNISIEPIERSYSGNFDDDYYVLFSQPKKSRGKRVRKKNKNPFLSPYRKKMREIDSQMMGKQLSHKKIKMLQSMQMDIQQINVIEMSPEINRKFEDFVQLNNVIKPNTIEYY